MADVGQDKTALGIARARFMDGLPRKAKELKGAVALLVASPDADRPREEMRRRLHALYASAQVFQEETLAAALRDGIQRLDSARAEHRGLGDEDLDMLVALAAQLPTMGSGRQGVASLSMRPRVSVGARPAPPPVPAPIPPPPPTEAVARAPEAPRPSTPQRPPSSRPAEVTRTDVITVLVIDDADSEAQVRRALAHEHFEVLATTEPEEALRIARAAAPDVVLIGHDVITGRGADLIERLRADPLTDFVPVILLWAADATHDPAVQGQVGADDSLRKPIDAPTLLRRIAALTAATGRPGSGLEPLHEGTVEQVADRIAREIRQGIVESVQSGRHQSISLGDGTDILAATWSAIGRIRSHLSQRSGGRVRFRDVPSGGAPAMLALVGDQDAVDDASVEQLKGRRVVVADDDPAVLWFFSGLLKEAGATVIEAGDGRIALEQTRRQRPDVVISDILMPEVDGFALCRELKRDVSVADIPVILLSWKEDFLLRMRELQSGASGYLLKESGGRQILTRVLEVLRPRLRLEEQLRAGGEVRGRIDGIGIMSLLECVAVQRPDSRVTVRDAWNLFEIDLRKGNLVTVSRTSTDGSFARGEPALRQMLGGKSGRFTVTDSDAQVRAIFDQPLARLLSDAGRKLSALLDAVSDTRIMQIHRVTFDDPTLAAMVSTSPTPTTDILERLRAGASPRQLVVNGECAPHVLESVLDDAARRGALTQVLGADGEDLVASALGERERDPGVLMHSTRPPAPRKSLAPVIDQVPELSSADLKSEPPGPMHAPIIAAIAPELPKLELAIGDSADDVDRAFELGSIPPPILHTSTPPPVPEVALRKRTAEEEPQAEPQVSDQAVAFARTEMSMPAPAAAPVAVQPKDVALEPAAAAPAQPIAMAVVEHPLVAAPAVSAVVAAKPVKSAPVVSPPKPQPKPAQVAVAPDAGAGVWQRVLFFVAVVAVGYGGYSTLQRHTRNVGAEVATSAPAAVPDEAAGMAGGDAPDDAVAIGAQPAGAQAIADATDPATAKPTSPPPTALTPSVSARDVGFGRVLPYIDQSRGVIVPAGEGLLVVEANAAAPKARIRIGDRDLGTAPVSTSLASGRHEVIFQRGDESSFRYLVIRGGETRIVQVP